MEQLNRSLSKLKPPSTIVRSNSSSALSTALAVAAAAMSENENYSATTFFGNRSIGASSSGTGAGNNTQTDTKKDHTLTLEMLEPLPPKTLAGTKRKAEDEGPSRPARGAPGAPTTRPQTTGRVTTAIGASRKPTVPTSGTQRQPRPQQTARPTARPTVRPATRTPLQTQPRPAVRPAPTAKPISKAPLATATRTGPTAAASRATRTSTPVVAPVRPRATPTAKPKAGPSQTGPTRTMTRARSTTPAGGAAQAQAQSKGVGIAAGVGVDVDLQLKKKRAPWDTKGRLQDMEEVTSALYQKLNRSTGNVTNMNMSLESNTDKISQLESFRSELQSNIAETKTEKKDILQKLSSVEREVQVINRKHKDDMRALDSKQSVELGQEESEQAKLQREMDTTQSNLRITSNRLEQQVQESATLRNTISTQSSNCLAFESDNRALKLKIERTGDAVAKREASIEELEQQLRDSQTKVRGLEQEVKDAVTNRRKLYNAIMDLKGHIRVFCRVRPNAPSEGTVIPIEYPGLEGREVVLAPAKGSKSPFTFDKVLPATSTQDDMFVEVSQMLPLVLSGGSACVFAYGTTGSGKSYTLEGPLGAAEESVGLIPRSTLHIYEATRVQESNGWKYNLEIQHLEIHNETIYDLQWPEGASTSQTHEIHNGPGDKVTVSGITKVELTSAVMIGSLLRIAQRRRTAIRTSLKENYRNGHCVFSIRVTGVNTGTGSKTEGILHFVDLVASDAQSDAQKKESDSKDKSKPQDVDQSLKGLGDVFLALSNKEPKVPYRRAKLTHLLQNAFVGGNTKMLFIVHISPLGVHLEQTLRSLRYAAKVNSCLLVTAAAVPSPSNSTASSKSDSSASKPVRRIKGFRTG
ncbi:hypothetical protein BGX29_005631 [Mortierella sp. GBA35]|nr:hypothetical protein BGX29_005631 [Mortierella sp. GBA35]